MTTKYVTAPCILHITCTATHAYKRKPSEAPTTARYTTKKKKTTKAQKVWGGHGQWGNNEKANKYVKNTKEGAKGAHHARIPKRTQSRKVEEN